MKKIILTSTGLDNKKIGKKFLEFIKEDTLNSRILFIPTAAVSNDQKLLIPFCEKDLLDVGISAGSIMLCNNLKNGLNYFNFELGVHSKEGSLSGEIDIDEVNLIKLTDYQYLVIEEGKTLILNASNL